MSLAKAANSSNVQLYILGGSLNVLHDVDRGSETRETRRVEQDN